MTTLADLITQETRDAIYSRILSFAVTVGLPTSTWHEGDPERTLFETLAYEMEAFEQVASRYVAAKFLDFAVNLTDTKWLKLTAYEQYGYTAREATYSTCTVTLSNASGNVYTIAAQDLVFAIDGSSDVTYHNTSGGTLNPGSTLTLDLECDLAGSQGSAGVGDIVLVTNVLGVAVSTNTAAVGVDEESPASIVAQCRNKLESLSPNGAAGAYSYVALNSELTGASDVTRCRVSADSATGDVGVYIASSSGGVSLGDRVLVAAALSRYCTPLCVTCTLTGASAYPIAITYTALVYDTVGVTTSAIEDAIDDALDSLFSSLPIGGDGASNTVYRSRIIAAITSVYPDHIYSVTLTSPASDVSLSVGAVATKGSVSATVTLTSAP